LSTPVGSQSSPSVNKGHDPATLEVKEFNILENIKELFEFKDSIICVR